MKTVKEPRKNIASIWKTKKLTQEIYRPLRFLINTEVEDGLILYNVVTSEMVLLDDKERRIFESLPAIYNPDMDELISRHFIVNESFDENKSVLQLRAVMKKLKPAKRVTGFTILPTTECNARCFYCFESDHERCTMTEKVANDVVDYIANQGKSQPIEISWFGGEPLVASHRISQICAGLKKRGIKYSSSMVSNAYLFNKQLIETAKRDWNVNSIQVTLDGTEETYNTTKAYVNPKDNPFKRVLGNIEELLAHGIVVSTRLNVTNSNAADLSDLIDMLAERFKERKGFSCYSHPVYEDVGFEPLEYDESALLEVDKHNAVLNAKLHEKKLNGGTIGLPQLKVIQCMADNDECRLIYPDGTIGKCENRSSLDNIGDIYEDITDKEMDMQYKTSKKLPACETCCLFPGCINLILCPETGRCSKSKRTEKINKYKELLREEYYNKRDGVEERDMDNVSEVCGV